MEPETTQTIETPVAVDAIPKIKPLFTEAWSFVKQRRDIVLWYAAPLVILSLSVSDYATNYAENNSSMHLLIIVSLVVGVYMIFNTLALLHAVHQPAVEQVPFKSSLGWAKGKFWPFVWLSIVSSVVIMLGYMALIIPGIILTGYFVFAQFAFYHDGVTGTKALKASYRVVKGRWWKVAKKVALAYLYFILIFVAVAMVLGVIEAIGGGGVFISLVADVVEQVFMAIVSIIVMFVLARLYEAYKS